jgi:hypothetical protein
MERRSKTALAGPDAWKAYAQVLAGARTDASTRVQLAPTITNFSRFEDTLSRLSLYPNNGVAIGIVLSLVGIVGSLFIASVHATVNSSVIAVATGLGVGAIAVAVTIAIVAIYRLRLPSNNDAWVLW